MIFEKIRTVYVLCGASFKTGGTELAHQLVYALNQMGVNSYITYHNADQHAENAINPSFLKYTKSYKRLQDIEDIEDDVLIIPETYTRFSISFSKIKLCIWWMSVDNYRAQNDIKWSFQNIGFLKTIYHILCKSLIDGVFPDKNVFAHFYQSEYAKDYLLSNGIANVYRLSDYLNDSYLQRLHGTLKEDIVIYNPRKGYSFTKKIIKRTPNINWVPITGMTNEEVIRLMQRSKVYIDFGNHPGKDRMPREAAMCECCIIVGKKGSARFFEDVSIEDKYKFEVSSACIDGIVSTIYECLNNYENCVREFAGYRAQISIEKKEFVDDVKRLFVE